MGKVCAGQTAAKWQQKGEVEKMVWLMTIWLIGISIMDIKSRRVPIWGLVPGALFAVLILADQYTYGEIQPYVLLAGLLPGVVLLAVAMTTQKAGYGDGIVLLLLGAVSGGGKSLFLFGVSLFLAAMGGGILIILRRAGRNTAIPYLPFLAVAWLLAGGL